MTYPIRPLVCDPAALPGLSEKLIRSHYDNNYAGAVKRLDAIRARLGKLDWAQAANFAINGLKREELIAANSAFLHELYFETFGGNNTLAPGGLSVAFNRDFGAFERWQAEFVALAKAMGGGSGWALCSVSARENRLVNHWAADHTHLLAGATPILALDMYEHAYHLDYGANAGGYVAAFMANIDWSKANARYAAAVERDAGSWGIANSQVAAAPQDYLILDVRRAGALKAAPSLIAGAAWQDPEKVEQWADSLPRTRPIVVYCVYGHEVGQSTTAILRSKGIDASYLTGGIQAWKEAGLPMCEPG